MANPLVRAGLGLACAVGFLAVAQSAHAQTRLHELLRSPRNVAEIELSEAQKRQIDDLRKQLRDRKSQMNRLMEEFQKDTQDRIMDVLTRRQRRRLSELYYQGRGPRAFEEPTTARALRLTEAQLKRIEGIRQEAQEKYRRDRRGYAKIMKERDAKYLTVLTPRQKSRWERMLGDPRKKELTLTSQQRRDLWSYLRRISPLTNRKYADDLKITDRQREKIQELARRLWMNNSEMKRLQQQYGERYEKAAGEQRKEEIQQEMAHAIAEFYERGVEKIDAVLTSRQRDRLSELRKEIDQRRYRSLGAAAFPSSADIAEQLGLTEAQQEKLKSLQQAARQAELKEQRESRARLQRIKAERDQDYLNVLTPKQRAKWEKMIGRPLKQLKPDV